MHRVSLALITLAACTLVAIVGVLVVSQERNERAAIAQAKQATAERNATARLAFVRITALQRELAHFQSGVNRRSRQIARLETELHVVVQQLRQLGVTPAVNVDPPAVTPTSSRTAAPPTSDPSSRTPTHKPSPKPSPSATCLLILCIK